MKFTGDVPESAPIPVSEFDNGHWDFPEQMGSPDKVGFIYVIYDAYLNRGYIGKKMYRGAGKANKGKESNWRTYKSSSKLLKEMFKERPMEEFEFVVIEEYTTKGTLSYSETWSLCYVEAPTSKVFYNTLIGKVTWNVKEPISERHKERLEAFYLPIKEGL